MPTSPINEVIQYLRSTLLPDGADLTDGQLLECFVSRREPTALEALVRRHGPMVWGVARRILQNHHDAEDAFQATFLVLTRKAASIRSGAQVGNWLYGVAHQTALKARATRAKQKSREVQVRDMPEPAVAERDAWGDLQAVLDQELSRLPEKYRTVIVLCDLEGKTGKQTARQLGLPQGTVASRLARARSMLAKRLARHGLTASGGTLAAVLSEQAASASVPGTALASTINAVTSVAAGQAAATSLVSAKAAALTEGVVKGMLLAKLKIAVTLGVVLTITGLGVGQVVLQVRAAEPPKGHEANEQQLTPKVEAPDRDKPAQDDLDRLQGPWRLVSSELEGVTLGEGRPEIKDTRLVIDRTSVKMSGKLIHSPNVKLESEDVTAVGTVTLDAKKKPKQIMFTWEANPWLPKEDLVQRGIYALDGDRLKLCFYFPGKDTRSLVPTEFSANAGSKRSLGTWKRVPPSEKAKEKKPQEEANKRPSNAVNIVPKSKAAIGQHEKEKAPDKDAEEKDKLQGTWQIVAYETEGLKVGEGRPELKENRLVIERDSVTLFYTAEFAVSGAPPGVKRATATFTLDAERTPPVMVLTWKECPWNGQKDFVRKAIFAVEGDSLKLCLRRKDEDKEAPSEFSAKAGSERLLWTFKRVPSSESEGEKYPAQRGRQGNEPKEKAPAAPAKEKDQAREGGQAAAGLSKIDRTIKQEPTYKSKPRYCLLVFGPQATKRIWIILDGDELYVDRDGNGDLTGKEKKAQRLPIPEPNKTQQVTSFLRHIPTAQGIITVEVTQTIYDRIRNNHGVSVWLEDGIERPGCLQRAGGSAEPTVFADRPQDAPVLHFFAPRQTYLAYFGPPGPRLVRGPQGSELYVSIGTPGSGKGSFVAHSHGGIPKDAHVVLDLEYPSKEEAGTKIHQRVTLAKRC